MSEDGEEKGDQSNNTFGLKLLKMSRQTSSSQTESNQSMMSAELINLFNNTSRLSGSTVFDEGTSKLRSHKTYT